MMMEIQDPVPLTVHGVLIDPNTDTQIVILRDTKKTEVLPIWVGTSEGSSIRLALEEIIPPRPMSHDLMMDVAEHLGFSFTKVIVNEVKNNTYYSHLYLTYQGEERAIDCRPSDAIAIAVRAKIPIFVMPEVLERKGSQNLDSWLAKLDSNAFDQHKS